MRITIESPIALVELPPTQFGILDGVAAEDIYTTVKMPPRALPTLSAVLRAGGFRNVRMFFPPFHGSVSYGPNWKWIRGCSVLMISSIVRTTPQSFQLIRLFKRANPGGLVIVGGPAPTFSPQDWLTAGADIIVFREGEVTLVELMARLTAGEDWRDVPGIGYKEGAEIALTLPRRRMTSEEWSQLPDPHYDTVLVKRVGQPALEQLRGCPHRCDFCNVTQFYEGSLRTLKVEAIIRRINALREVGLGKHWFMTGDNANANERFARRMFQAIIDSDVIPSGGITMQVSAQVGQQGELLDLAYQAGARTACIGLESTLDDSLQEVGKPYDSGDNLKAVRVLKERGFWVHGMFVVTPDGPKDQVDNILEWGQMHIDSVQIFPATPFEGTPFADRMKTQGRILTPNLYLYDAQHVTIRPEYVSPYDQQVEINNAYRKFYSLEWAKQRFQRSPDKLRSFLLGGYALVGGLRKGLDSVQMKAHLEFLKSAS